MSLSDLDCFELAPGRCDKQMLLLSDPGCGLRAMLAIDSLLLGPAVGGIRTMAYRTAAEAARDAAMLAEAMTLKCAIAGLEAGGAKTVLFDHPRLDRPRAFRALGRFIDGLGGIYQAAGDLGTTPGDLAEVASQTRHVHRSDDGLSSAAGKALLHCLTAAAASRGHKVAGLRIAVQGCGVIGSAAARAFAAAGAEILVADLDPLRARALAGEIGGQAVPADQVLLERVDVVSPCAGGGILTAGTVEAMAAWCICGGANNQLESPAVAALLDQRDILYIPDFLASAGAVIHGVAPRMARRTSEEQLLARLYATTLDTIAQAKRDRTSTDRAARCIAARRLRARE